MKNLEGIISVINIAGKNGLPGYEKFPIEVKRNELLGLISKINKCQDALCIPSRINRRIVPVKFQQKRSFKSNPQEIIRSLSGILGNHISTAKINRDPFRRLLMNSE
jgi:hypothetical protein